MIARLAFLAAALLVWRWDQRRRQRDPVARDRSPEVMPAAVSVWVGEGGALRGTGAQLGKAPVQP